MFTALEFICLDVLVSQSFTSYLLLTILSQHRLPLTKLFDVLTVDIPGHHPLFDMLLCILIILIHKPTCTIKTFS